jgi:signal transduction histidine kinase
MATAPDLTVPAATEVTVLRVMQEALANVQKHARAARVTIRLDREAEWLTLAIVDDGCGLAPAGQGNPSDGTGTGLGSMRERAELLGGTLDVTSRPGSGTEVLLRVPAVEQGEMRR